MNRKISASIMEYMHQIIIGMIVIFDAKLCNILRAIVSIVADIHTIVIAIIIGI